MNTTETVPMAWCRSCEQVVPMDTMAWICWKKWHKNHYVGQCKTCPSPRKPKFKLYQTHEERAQDN